MRRFPLLALLLAVPLLAPPAVAHAAAPTAAHAAAPAAVASVTALAGTAWTTDPATGRMTVAVDDTVSDSTLAGLRARLAGTGTVVHREPGRLRTLIAGGQAIYGPGGVGRCSLGANVRSGSTYYFVTSGHCAAAATTWYADSAGTTLLGTRVGNSFPGNDYGIVRYSSATIPHPSAVYTYPGTLAITGVATPVVGMVACRSGSTTGVRCGSITGVNVTVNFPEGSVSGLIRTNICAEPGDSGGPLYAPGTGKILGILSGGSGNCTSGGTTYYQPIQEILAVYGVTIP